MKQTRKDKTAPLTVHVSLKPETLKRLDSLAQEENRTRANMIVVLIEKGMSQEVSA